MTVYAFTSFMFAFQSFLRSETLIGKFIHVLDHAEYWGVTYVKYIRIATATMLFWFSTIYIFLFLFSLGSFFFHRTQEFCGAVGSH